MIDPTLSGVEDHLVTTCQLCRAPTVRASCPVLGTLRLELADEPSDVYECPSCDGITRRSCVLGEVA